jgi:hypothetical protein
MSSSPRVALYARVSTSQGQDVGLQLDELRSSAAQRGWTIAGEYVDEGISGARARRPALDKLLEDAQAGKFTLVAIWKLDRLARSVTHLLQMTESFNQWGVGLVSLRDAHIDTTTPTGRFTLQILGAVADYAQPGVMQSCATGSRLGSRFTGSRTPHYPGSRSEAMSASGALNRPRRSDGGRTASTASSFSVGSMRR